MTPQHFQDLALSWIGVGTMVLIAAAGAIGKVLGALQATQEEIKARQNRQGTRVDAALLNSPPPGSAPVQTVNAPAAQTVTVTDAPAMPVPGAGGSGGGVSAQGATMTPPEPFNPNKTGGFMQSELAPVIPPAVPKAEAPVAPTTGGTPIA